MKKLILIIAFIFPVMANAQTDSVTLHFGRADKIKKQPVNIFLDGRKVTTISETTEYKVLKIAPGKHTLSAQYGKDESEFKQTIPLRFTLEFPSGETFYFKSRNFCENASVLELQELSKYSWKLFSETLSLEK